MTIPNERLLDVVERGTSFFEAFRVADDILLQAVQGISGIITIPGIINRDFADIRTVMHGMGYAVMGTAEAAGPSAAVEAARKAVNSPLLEDASIEGARGILINITGGQNLSLHEVHEACTIIQRAADPGANIIFGCVMDESMGDKVKLTVIATGFREEMASGVEPHDVHGHANVRTMPVRNDLTRSRVPNGAGLQPPPRMEEQIAEERASREEAPAVDPSDREQPAFLRRKIE